MALPQFTEEQFTSFDMLTAPLRDAFGPFDREPMSAPGSIDLVSRARDGLYVTCGLADAPGRAKSADGLAYELVMFTGAAPETAQAILGYVADCHADEALEDGGLASVEGLGDLPNQAVRITKYADGPEGMGLYQVSFA